MDPFVPLGRVMETGRRKCSYSPADTPASDCDELAAWHILWDPSGDAGLACGLHMATARSRFVFVDSHLVGPHCGMPGAAWSCDEKRCVRPGDHCSVTAEAGMPVQEVVV